MESKISGKIAQGQGTSMQVDPIRMKAPLIIKMDQFSNVHIIHKLVKVLDAREIGKSNCCMALRQLIL